MCIELKIKDKIVEMSGEDYFNMYLLEIAELMDKAILEVETVTTITDNVMDAVAMSIANWIVYKLTLITPLDFMEIHTISTERWHELGTDHYAPPVNRKGGKNNKTSEIEMMAILTAMLSTVNSMHVTNCKELVELNESAWVKLGLPCKSNEWFYQFTNKTKTNTMRKRIAYPLVSNIIAKIGN